MPTFPLAVSAAILVLAITALVLVLIGALP